MTTQYGTPEYLKKSVRDLYAKVMEEEREARSKMKKPTKEMWFFLLRLKDSGAYNMIDPSVANLLRSTFSLTLQHAEDVHLYYCVNFEQLMSSYGDDTTAAASATLDATALANLDSVTHDLAHKFAHAAALDKAAKLSSVEATEPVLSIDQLAAAPKSPIKSSLVKTCPGAPKKKTAKPSKKVKFSF